MEGHGDFLLVAVDILNCCYIVEKQRNDLRRLHKIYLISEFYTRSFRAAFANNLL